MTISINNFLTENVGKVDKTSTKTTNKTYSLRHLKDFETKIDWDELTDIVFQSYLESGIGHLINPAETMLKSYFLQYHYGMSANYIETALSKNNTLKQFVLIIDAIPKASDINAFADLLHKKTLSTKIEKAFSAI